MVTINKENLKFIGGGEEADLLSQAEGKPFSYAVGLLNGNAALARQIYYTQEGYVTGVNRQKFLSLVTGRPLSYAVNFLNLEEGLLRRTFNIQEGYIIEYNN